MSTKWSTQILGRSGTPDFGSLLKDEYTVVLLKGKNVFNDMIYCYVKIMFPDLKKLDAALASDDSFHPSDFGTVVAAGKGEPPEEVKAEIALTYPLLGSVSPMQKPVVDSIAIPTEKKAWDEY